MDRKTLQVVVNLGGWLSQYPARDPRHFDSFITAEDIKRVAGWGFDHIRLPVDYPLLEDEPRAGGPSRNGWEYLESCLGWCQENHLSVILDLHKAPGYTFQAPVESPLFADPALQERFLALWQTLTHRFCAEMEDGLAFELLNEVFLPTSDPWNALVRRAVAMIRTEDSQRLIVIGANRYNAPGELSNLEIIPDPNILFTFHFYAPLVVTHQRAPWIQALLQYDRAVDYPGFAPGLEVFLQAHPEHRNRLGAEVGKRFDWKYLQSELQPSLEFSQRTNQPTYCGEFGVYEQADPTTRQNWTRDVIDLLHGFGIGRAYWTYKAMDFGLVDKDGQVVSQELIAIISRW
jgi:aryl-phospho-beta-D-glucosidase BglC (GH1 family)